MRNEKKETKGSEFRNKTHVNKPSKTSTHSLDDLLQGARPVRLDEALDGLACVKAHHLQHLPLPLTVAGAHVLPDLEVASDVSLVDVGRAVEDGQHQPAAEE